MFRIKELRESKGISMKEAARRLEMPYTTYVNYEKGLREPTSEVLIQIADFFGVSIDFLVGRKTSDSNDNSVQSENSIFKLSTEKKNVILIAARDGSFQERTLTDQQLAAFLAILDQMPDVPEDL